MDITSNEDLKKNWMVDEPRFLLATYESNPAVLDTWTMKFAPYWTTATAAVVTFWLNGDHALAKTILWA